MGKKQYGFAFFLTLYVQIIDTLRPESGWPFLPEFFHAVSPAFAALVAHLTVLGIVLLDLPTESQLRTRVQIWNKRKRISNKLNDPTISTTIKDQLRVQLEQLHLTELNSYEISILPVNTETDNDAKANDQEKANELK